MRKLFRITKGQPEGAVPPLVSLGFLTPPKPGKLHSSAARVAFAFLAPLVAVAAAPVTFNNGFEVNNAMALSQADAQKFGEQAGVAAKNYFSSNSPAKKAKAVELLNQHATNDDFWTAFLTAANLTSATYRAYKDATPTGQTWAGFLDYAKSQLARKAAPRRTPPREAVPARAPVPKLEDPKVAEQRAAQEFQKMVQEFARGKNLAVHLEALAKLDHAKQMEFFNAVYDALRQSDRGGFSKRDFPDAKTDGQKVLHLQTYLALDPTLKNKHKDVALAYQKALAEAGVSVDVSDNFMQGIRRTGYISVEFMKALAIYCAVANNTWEPHGKEAGEKTALTAGAHATAVPVAAARTMVEVWDSSSLQSAISYLSGDTTKLFSATTLETWLQIKFQQGYKIADWDGFIGYFEQAIASGKYGKLTTDADYAKAFSERNLDSLLNSGQLSAYIAHTPPFTAEDKTNALYSGDISAVVELNLGIPVGSSQSATLLRANDAYELEKAKAVQGLLAKLQDVTTIATDNPELVALAAVVAGAAPNPIELTGQLGAQEKAAISAIQDFLAAQKADKANTAFADAWTQLRVGVFTRKGEFDLATAKALTAYLKLMTDSGNLDTAISDYNSVAPRGM